MEWQIPNGCDAMGRTKMDGRAVNPKSCGRIATSQFMAATDATALKQETGSVMAIKEKKRTIRRSWARQEIEKAVSRAFV